MPILWLAGQAGVFIALGFIIAHWGVRDWQLCIGVGLIVVGGITAFLALAFIALELLIMLFA